MSRSRFPTSWRSPSLPGLPYSLSLMQVSETDRPQAVVSIPKDADPVEYCPLLCAGVTVFNSLRKQGIIPGSTVAVQGLGGLGHLALQYTSKMGFRTVAISSSDAKKDFAMKLGAHGKPSRHNIEVVRTDGALQTTLTGRKATSGNSFRSSAAQAASSSLLRTRSSFLPC